MNRTGIEGNSEYVDPELQHLMQKTAILIAIYESLPKQSHEWLNEYDVLLADFEEALRYSKLGQEAPANISNAKLLEKADTLITKAKKI